MTSAATSALGTQRK
jgi:hypothetical protein